MNLKKHFSKSFLALLLGNGFMLSAYAQPTGANYSNPVVVGTLSCGTIYSDTKNNNSSNNYGNDYTTSNTHGQQSDDIVYQFTLSSTSDVTISTCTSPAGISDSYIHLVDNTGSHTELAYNDDNGPVCSSSNLASLIKTSLAAGTYFVVVEGYSTHNGDITTQISLTTPGATIYNPINVTFGSCPNAAFVDTKTNGACYGNEIGRASNDIFYKFTLTETKSMSFSTCNSGGLDTYIYLLDNSGSLIISNDDNGELCEGVQASIVRPAQYALTAGTYYLVSETYSATPGSITTEISPFCGLGIASAAPATKQVVKEGLTLQVYPNPFSNLATLKLEGNSGYARIEITTINGALVYKSESHKQEETITLGADLQAGVYLVKVTNEVESKILKLVKVQ